MAEGVSGGVNRKRFQVAYIGDAANDHAMDVDALGPALVAFGQLMRAANSELNKDRAAVRVLVASEFEHKCFNINFEVVQTVIEQMRDLLDSQGIKNATELLAKIGVVSGTTIGTVVGYLRWKKGRKVQAVQEVKDSPHAVVVKVEGEGHTVNIGLDVFRLAQNKDLLDALQGAFVPINDKHQASSIEFRQADQPVAVLTREDVKAILASCKDRSEVPLIEKPKEEKKTATATLYVYGPVFDPKAPNWRFLYRNKPIYADVKETDIAKDAVARGGSFMHDRYRVKMEVTPPETEDGTPHYKIIEVLEFTPAERQMPLPLKSANRKALSRARK